MSILSRIFQRKATQHLLLAIVACCCIFWSHPPTPSYAQTPATPVISFRQRAPVAIDGRVLFFVSDTANRRATERAQEINAILARLVETPAPPQVEIAQENQLTTLRINNRHLVTVTSEDLREGLTTTEQARMWQQQVIDAFQLAQTERSPLYMRQASIASAIVLAGAIAGHLFLQVSGQFLAAKLGEWLTRNPVLGGEWDDPLKRFVRLGFSGLQVGLWLAVGYFLTDLFPWTRRWRYELFNLFFASLTAPVFTLDQRGYSILDILLLIVFGVLLWLGVRSVTKLFQSRLLNHSHIDRRMQDVLAIAFQSILMFVGLTIILQMWGLNVSSLAIIASVLGVGIGFGLQNIANNLMSGLIITLERNIQVGDFVEVSNLMGTVEYVGARSTRILTLDQVTIIVPNSRFLESEVINWSHSSPVCRLHLPVGVAYRSDPSQVRSLLLEVAKGHPDVLMNPPPQVFFRGFGESALNFDLLIWTREPRKQFFLKSELYFRVEKVLRQHHITVPFPQRDLHLSPQLEEMFSDLLARSNGYPSPDRRTRTPRESLPLNDRQLREIVAQMQGEGGVEVKDRTHRQNLYPACFIGAEAVDWWIATQQLTRSQALQLGQLLCDRAWIESVSDEGAFEDGYQFYRFSPAIHQGEG